MKMYISKYAFSSGIMKVQVNESEVKGNLVYPRADGYFVGFFIGNEIHNTREEAVAAAETLRAKKIASIKKQLAKLEAMEF